MKPTIGKRAPTFNALSTQGLITLEKCQGCAMVLYFYPKDDTAGCTQESQDFRDRHDAFLKATCRVVGISRDTLASHHNFQEKYQLPFPLISDEDSNVCNLFGVIKEKNVYGKKSLGIERSTFLINADGKLVQEWRGLKVPGHAQQVLEAAQNLS